MIDYFFSLQALVSPDTIDVEFAGTCDWCFVCKLANEENQ